MPVFGLNNGIVPIVAYNYGAKNKERLLKTIKVGTLMAVAIMTFGMLLFLIIPEHNNKLKKTIQLWHR